jgi:hypothetical protein
MLCMAFGHVPSIVTAEEISVGPCVATQRCQGPIREPVRHEQVVSRDQERSFAGTIKTAGATVLDDAAYLVTSPLRMDLESGLITAGVLGAVGGVMAFDSNIQKWVQKNRTQSGSDFFNRVQTIGDAALPVNAGLAAAGYFFRGSEEGNKLFQTSLVSLEAQMLAGGLTQMAKFAIGRDRPNQDPQGNSYDPFQKLGQAFPSGHSTQMFALAAVFSEQYSLPVQVLAYSLAIAVSAERVYQNHHFTSDVLAGAAIGYVVGKALAFRHTYGDRGLSFMPLAVPGGGGVTLQYRF